MTDGKTPEQAGAGVATPQSQTSPEPVAPNTATPAENEQEKQPQYVTVDQLSQFGKTLAAQLKQSDRDRSKRIEGELAQMRELMKNAGVSFDPNQEQKLREEIANRIDGSEPAQVEAVQQQQTPASVDPVVEFVSGAFDEVGTAVTRNDPEWAGLQKVIDATFNDPSPKAAARVLAAATEAAKQKAARQTTSQEAAAARVGGEKGGAVTGNGPNDPNAPAADFWKAAFKK